MRIYIIGSISQIGYIEKLHNFLKHAFKDYAVKAVQKEPDRSLRELISDCFDEIERSDIIIALAKPDGTYGDGVLYEIEYARRCHKIIMGTREDMQVFLASRIECLFSN